MSNDGKICVRCGHAMLAAEVQLHRTFWNELLYCFGSSMLRVRRFGQQDWHKLLPTEKVVSAYACDGCGAVLLLPYPYAE